MAAISPVSLQLEARPDRNQRLRALRRAGRLPAVIYGRRVDAVSVAVDAREFVRAFQKVGKTQLLDLQIGDEPPRKALVREVQRDPRDGELLHVDFYQVNLLEKIESEVPLEIEGEVEVVVKGAADLLSGLHQLRVRCLPTDLPPAIRVDVSGLQAIDDEIRVRDLRLPAGVEVLDEPDELIVKVHAHREEVEAAAPIVVPEVPVVGEAEAAAPAAESEPES